MSNDKGVEVMLKNVRISFPYLFTPQENKNDQGQVTLSYGVHALIEPDSPAHQAAREAVRQVARNQWGENGDTVLQQLAEQGRVCLRNGNTKTTQDGAPMDGYAGNWFLSARSKQRPTVVGPDRSPLTEADGKPYSGCYCNVKVRIWPQVPKGGQNFGKRINAQLQGVQFVKDGEAFGGGRVASPEEFDSLDEFATGESSSGGDADLGGLI